jgi:2'-5' RNA ligase
MTGSWSEDDADAASFLAVVPPDSVGSEIVELQRRAGVDVDVVPHVTVKAQPGLEHPDRWRPRVRAALAEIEPFEISLLGVSWFGSGIVYLAVSSPIVELHRVVLAAVESVSTTPGFEYEGNAYVPHLTIAADFAGATPDQLRSVSELAGARQWAGFTVDAVHELRRSSPTERYLIVERVPLGRADHHENPTKSG